MLEPTLTICIGLPASGKSTWSRQLVRGSAGQIKRVNRDSLRDMVDAGGMWDSRKEKVIKRIEFDTVGMLLGDGFDVVVDDTNLDPALRQEWEIFARNHSANFDEHPFMNVTSQECIRRDLDREHPVGEEVIMRMYAKWLSADAPQGNQWLIDTMWANTPTIGLSTAS